MSLYVVICIDKPNALETRVATREAHLAYAKTNEHAQIRVGGPFLSEDGAMNGSLLIVEAEGPAKVDAFVRNDPYGQAGLFERVEVRPWKATVGSLG